MSRHCTVIIQVGHCIVPVKCQIDRPVLQFYMSDIACGSAPQDFKEIFLERISAYTIEYIHKCIKNIDKYGSNYFKVITHF